MFRPPANNRRARQASLWSRYLDVWTVWNHVRTLAPILSAILFTAALLLA